MVDDIILYRQIADRERRSRVAAEALLEQKALELFDQNKQLEAQTCSLRELNSILSNVMRASPDAILTCCSDYKITGMNEKAESWFGGVEKDWIGKPLSSVLSDHSTIQNLSICREIFIERAEICSKSQTTKPVEIRGTKGLGDDARCHLVLFLHDITTRLRNAQEKERLKDRVDEARRLEAIGMLSSGIAHEINTPMQYIGDNVLFLREALDKIHQSYGHYHQLYEACEPISELRPLLKNIEDFNKQVRLNSLISNIFESISDSVAGIDDVQEIISLMKEFVHKGDAPMEPVSINSILEKTLKICRNKIRNVADVHTEFDPRIPLVPAGRSQLQQVFMNIILNAVDAVSATQQPDPVIHVNTCFNQDSVEITISDNGPGIPNEIRSRIFDPFFTSKEVGKGTGQGLAIAKDIIVNGHSGELDLIDVPGFSTTFRISIPISVTHTVSAKEKIHAA